MFSFGENEPLFMIKGSQQLSIFVELPCESNGSKFNNIHSNRTSLKLFKIDEKNIG
jgi:hypothetical protein